MCGIAGLFGYIDPTSRDDALTLMLAAIRHRGPDDQGRSGFQEIAFGMRRLSILDPTPAGHQPMSSRDGRYHLIHNGEIYNFLELAVELRELGFQFETSTDTEVILASYAAWGPACVERFNGIWAFALWDERDGTLLLSRDRFGVKPLFVAEHAGRLAFASEIKALLTLAWVARDPDASAVRDFLLDGLTDHTEHTFFQAVRRVPAAHNLLVRRDGQLLQRYWGPPALNEDALARSQGSDADRLDEIRSLLVDSVALQLRSDVPVGSCLSGGLDSSAIVSIAAGLRDGRLSVVADHLRTREQQPQLAFFAEFHDEGIDERQFVDAVVASTGIDLRTTSPDMATFITSIDEIVRIQDEPFLSTSIVAQYHVMKIAHEARVKVLLDGQGADEAFAGYPQYTSMAIAGGIRSGNAFAMRRSLRAAMRRYSKLPQTLGHVVLAGRPVPRRLRRDRIPGVWLGGQTRRAASLDAPIDARAGTTLALGLWRHISSENLPSLLRYEDRNSMAFGIEARVPFLDHRLVEAALLLPDRLKVDGGERKVALRRAVQGIVPTTVLDRRDKVSFQAPPGAWVRELIRQGHVALGGHAAVSLGLLDPRAFAQATAAFQSDPSAESQLWRLLSLELWARTIAYGDAMPAS